MRLTRLRFRAVGRFKLFHHQCTNAGAFASSHALRSAFDSNSATVMRSMVGPVSPTCRISSSLISRIQTMRCRCKPEVVRFVVVSLSGLSRLLPRISTKYTRSPENFRSSPFDGLNFHSPNQLYGNHVLLPF